MKLDAAGDPLFQERKKRIARMVSIVILIPGKPVPVAVEAEEAPHTLNAVVYRLVAAVAFVGVVQMPPPRVARFRLPANAAAIVLKGKDSVAGEL